MSPTRPATSRSKQSAIDDVPRPEAGQLERPDEPELLAVLSEVGSELPDHVDSVTEQGLSGSRLDFDLGQGSGHRFT